MNSINPYSILLEADFSSFDILCKQVRLNWSASNKTTSK